MASQAIQVAKKAFRPELKKILDSISAQERAKQSALITKKVKLIDLTCMQLIDYAN